MCTEEPVFFLLLNIIISTQDLWNCSHHLGPRVKLAPSLSPAEPAIERDKKSGCCMMVLCAKLANFVLAYH